MTNDDQYVISVLNRHQSSSSILVAQSVINAMSSSINTWSNGHLYGVYPSGSIAKGTAISESSDVDILISLKTTATTSLKDIYETLFTRLTTDGYAPRRQNVSLGVVLSGWKIDVVPARKQSPLNNDHSLWSHKSQTWRETNIHQHVQYVTNSNRINEIKLLKIWKKLHNLEFPSFPLEVTVINALYGKSTTTPAANFVTVLEYIRDSLPTVRIIDPTKPSNILSDELTLLEKRNLSTAARNSLGGRWNQVLW
jgi:hypothetical protein